jgi:DUF1009 family protein
VGLETIETMIAANIRTLAIEAGKAVVFDRQAMINRADEKKMVIVALDKDPSAIA